LVLDPVRIAQGQLNQPVVIDHLLRGLRQGFFLDIGANHPKFNSNTFFFEMERGYRGIALDPLEQYRDEWQRTRPGTIFMNVAAGAEAGKVTFYQHANNDGWEDQLSFTSLSGDADRFGLVAREVAVIPMADLEAIPQNVAFASIDVEGAESAVLEGFRGSLRPAVLIVENCFGPVGNRSLRKQVKGMGYRLVGRISYIDDVFVRADLAQSMPTLKSLRQERRDLFR
jgi:FkbM family methyltransferase